MYIHLTYVMFYRRITTHCHLFTDDELHCDSGIDVQCWSSVTAHTAVLTTQIVHRGHLMWI